MIIRSYKPDDPIRELAEKAVDALPHDPAHKVLVRFVDVANGKQFAAAVNEHRPTVLLYDGHGKSDLERGTSYLDLAEEELNLQEIRAMLTHFPTVVFLSACLTHPVDTHHESTALGALTWPGVRSVIGTFGPVSGEMAAVMIARFVHWTSTTLKDFLAGLRGSSVTDWAHGFSIFQRMSYATDMILGLFQQSRAFARSSSVRFTQEVFIKLQFFGNCRALESGNWLSRFIHDIADVCKLQPAFVKAEWSRVAYYTDSLKYVHMGSPESILLVPETGE